MTARTGAAMAAGPPPEDLLPDPRRVRRGFDRVSEDYDRLAFLQPRLRATLLERLDLVRLHPEHIVDAGCATGQGALALARRYRRARVLAVDLSPRMAARAGANVPWRLGRRIGALCADAGQLPLPDHSVDLVFSNLLPCWHPDPARLFAEFHRVLRAGGLLTFATLGPDTLRELRTAWRGVDRHAHVNLFLDMHDLGDALLRAGLGEPVMDTETMTVTHADVDALLADLRATGGGNALPGRRPGLWSRAGLARLREACEPLRDGDGRLPATVEVVYGHAWGRGPGRSVPGGGTETRFPLSALRGSRPPRNGG